MRTLLLSAAGLLVGELFSLSVQAGGPALGVVHPAADAVAIALFELAGVVFTSSTKAGR